MDVPLYWQNSPEYVLSHVHLPLLHVPWPPHLLLSQAICIRRKKKKSHIFSALLNILLSLQIALHKHISL